MSPVISPSLITASFLVGMTFSSTSTFASPIELPAMTAVVSIKDPSRGFLGGAAIAENCTVGLTPAQRVDQLRSEFGLSAEQLARIFGVSRRTVNNWISGKAMSEDNLRRLMRIESRFSAVAGDPEERRIAIFSQSLAGGLSLYEALRAEVDAEVLQAVASNLASQLGV